MSRGRPRGSKNRTFTAKQPNEKYMRSVAFRLPITARHRSSSNAQSQASQHFRTRRETQERDSEQYMRSLSFTLPIRASEVCCPQPDSAFKASEKYFRDPGFHSPIRPPGRGGRH